ncbi:MAG TPA: hypothetical protein VIG99_20430 [Myxococcaceae bacterium]
MRAPLRWLSWIAVAAVVLCPALAGAQDRVGGGGWGGYESPLGHVRAYSGVTGGFAPGQINMYGLGGVFEPKAVIWDFIVLGARIDGAALLGVDAQSVSQAQLALRIVGAAMLKAELLLFPGEIRPFIGLGVGWYAAVMVAGGAGGTNSFSGTGPGGMPQIGVDLGWFRAAAQYHFMLGELGAANYLSVELAWRVY